MLTINEVSTESQKLISMINDDILTDQILSAWNTCLERRQHGDNARGYRQRKTMVDMAHVRHNIKMWSQHEIYHGITTWGELATSDSFGESRLELRLTIIAGEFSDRPIQDRGIARELQVWFHENVMDEVVEA